MVCWTLRNIKLRQILVKTYWRENYILFNETCFEMIDGRRNSKLIGIILNWCDRFLIESLRIWNAMKRLKFNQSINLEWKQLGRNLSSKNSQNRHFWGIWLFPCGLVCWTIRLSVRTFCTYMYTVLLQVQKICLSWVILKYKGETIEKRCGAEKSKKSEKK